MRILHKTTQLNTKNPKDKTTPSFTSVFALRQKLKLRAAATLSPLNRYHTL
jgi:hypothetical protein